MSEPTPRPRAVFLSPHLDDAVFSAGGTIACLAAAGWAVTVATVFTASHPAPTGFALACQTDKGIAAGVDYMALRRGEDAEACAALGASAVWLGLEEAPHRGYHSAAALFAAPRPGDPAEAGVAAALASLRLGDAELVAAAEGIGGHVDHVLLRRAIDADPVLARRCVFWRDEPYASKTAAPLAPDAVAVQVEGVIAEKAAAILAYRTQLDFQFGGADAARAFAQAGGPGRVGTEWLRTAGPDLDLAGIAVTERSDA